MRNTRWASAGILLLASMTSSALEVKQLADNQTALTKISAKELTKIFVDGDRIKKLDGQLGAYTVKQDDLLGQVYIQPTQAYQNKTFSVTILTEQGHSYLLFLVPIDVPSQIIEIKPTSPVKKLAMNWEQNSAYGQLLIKLISAMVSGDNPDGYAVTHGGSFKPMSGYGERVSVKLKATYSGAKVRGEIFSIKNISSAIVMLDEKAFYQPGTRAISLQSKQLAPQVETIMYRVMTNGHE